MNIGQGFKNQDGSKGHCRQAGLVLTAHSRLTDSTAFLGL